jgi:hypothetical protein
VQRSFRGGIEIVRDGREARVDFRFVRRQHGGEGEDAPAPRAQTISATLLTIDPRQVADRHVKPNAIDSQRMYPHPPYVYRVQ